MKVLVTGANGFLGAWLTKTLISEGHEVYALIRKNSDLSELEGVKCIYLYGDVTDKNSLIHAMNDIDSVFHLAGVIAYKKSDRALMERVNVQGTDNVIAACLECKVRRLVYVSSVVAVGASFQKNSILNESSTYDIARLNLGYFETKHNAEELVKKACLEKNLNAVILNPSTIYGAGDAKKGSRKMQVKVAQGRFKFYTSGGVNVVAVEDVVAGIMSAWHIGKQGERYILCGENILIKELFAMVAAEAGVPAPHIKIPNWILHFVGLIGDLMDTMGLKGPLSQENAYTSTMYHWFDSSKAQKELKFHPRPAKEAIHNSVQWMKDHKLV